jgi:hypothetical protein
VEAAIWKRGRDLIQLVKRENSGGGVAATALTLKVRNKRKRNAMVRWEPPIKEPKAKRGRGGR